VLFCWGNRSKQHLPKKIGGQRTGEPCTTALFKERNSVPTEESANTQSSKMGRPPILALLCRIVVKASVPLARGTRGSSTEEEPRRKGEGDYSSGTDRVKREGERSKKKHLHRRSGHASHKDRKGLCCKEGKHWTW